MDKGLSKADIAALVSAATPTTLFVALLLSKRITGARALHTHLSMIPVRIVLATITALVVHLYPAVDPTAGLPSAEDTRYKYFMLLVLVGIVSAAASVVSMVSLIAFFAQVADPRIGGTFMTLLNTAGNIGFNIARVISLSLVEPLSSYSCLSAYDSVTGQRVDFLLPQCHSDPRGAGEQCSLQQGHCVVTYDGFLVESIVFAVLGSVWLGYLWPKMLRLARAPKSSWVPAYGLISPAPATAPATAPGQAGGTAGGTAGGNAVGTKNAIANVSAMTSMHKDSSVTDIASSL